MRSAAVSAQCRRFYRGMLVDVPLQLWRCRPAPRDIHAVLAKAYADRPLVKVA